jgi:tetratricopeptide (TPR) repeat protein
VIARRAAELARKALARMALTATRSLVLASIAFAVMPASLEAAEEPANAPAVHAEASVDTAGEGKNVGNRSASKRSTLEQALAAYAEAQATSAAADRPAAFARAERLFAAAAADGASADLWTNVGTAALQAEHLGTAILAYRRALALDPDHRHARQNLVHARSLLPAWVPRPESGGFLDSLVAWQHAMSPAERRGAAAVAFLAGAAMLGAALAGGSTALRVFAAVPLIAWALLFASGVAAAGEKGGVIAAAEAVARAADSRNAPARFAEALPAGTEVVIAEVRGDWTRIVLADGRDAWVGSASVEPVQ